MENEIIRKAHFCWKHPRYVRWQSKLKTWNYGYRVVNTS